MAMQALTVRGIEALKPQAKRYEVFDALTPGLAIRVTHNTVTAIYDRYRYDKEKRAALEKWAEVLSGIVDVKPAPTTAPARRARGQNVYEFKAPTTRRAQASVH